MSVLPCTKDRIPAVVEFLTRKPAHVDPAEHARLCEYYQEVYVSNPWYDPDLPSLVCQDARGRIAGFQGLIPRPMALGNGEQVRAVTASNLRVGRNTDGRTNPLIAMRLTKACLEGPQDLTVADRSSWESKKIWEACGGIAVPLYSFDWLRPIRPARALLEVGEMQRGRAVHRGLRWLADAADVVGAKLLARLARDGRATYTVSELDRQYAVEALRQAPGFDLRPRYDLASFSWLLEMSRNGAVGGWLRAAMVRDDRGQREVGWFVCAQRSERVGRVMQLVAMPGHFDTVLRAAIEDAASKGLALLYGEVDPSDLQSYRDTACLLHTGGWMLIHARRPALLESFLRGRALFTGLDGSSWVRPIWDGALRRAAV
jgi:hypothetical protein